jgi:hypothetical protein
MIHQQIYVLHLKEIVLWDQNLSILLEQLTVALVPQESTALLF